jgi:iron complex transport system permease protein
MVDAVMKWPSHRPVTPFMLVAILAIPALALTYHGWSLTLSVAQWPAYISSRSAPDISTLIFTYSLLPRFVLSLICGGALALSGVVFQTVLRNPLAEPATLGSAAGAQLALTIASLQAPWLLENGRVGVALMGAAAATILTFGLSWRRSLSPVSVIVIGLVVSLTGSALSDIFAVLHHEQLRHIFIWSTGSLTQNGWTITFSLLLRLVTTAVFSLFLIRPLTMMRLDDENARSLGLSLLSSRLLALGIAVALAAFTVSAVGVIGFIGLAAPALARASGVRRMRDQLIWAPVMGATLLWLADQLAQFLERSAGSLPTGTATAVLGAPLLLWMLPRSTDHAFQAARGADQSWHAGRPGWLIAGLIILLVFTLWPALDIGQGPSGWHVSAPSEFIDLWRWRWPRVTAALAAGAMLAVSGTLIQRLTSNPMASPEVLGVSSGAALGVILLAFATGIPDRTSQLFVAAVGAALVLALLLIFGRRASFPPERLLLAGIAIGTVAGAVTALLMVSGDPRLQLLSGWLSGSTYQVSGIEAVTISLAAIVLLAVTPFTCRWLAIMPLGMTASRSLGLGRIGSQSVILLIASTLAASATLVVGPLSFVGLMGPHLARLIGLQRPMQQIISAAAIGALIMVLADWFGRNLLFPYQIPAGQLASLVGGPFLLWSMWRRR